MMGACKKECAMAADENQDEQNQGKVGSDPEAAKKFASEGDFGIPSEDAAPDMTIEDRDYPGRPAGNIRTRTGASGRRTVGVGSTEGPDGKGSGGEVDPDIIGLDGRGGIASDGELGAPAGPDDSDGSSNEFASGGPAKGENRGRYQPGEHAGDVQQRDISSEREDAAEDTDERATDETE
jgi:hypothetical protein